ncbi:hypothetical protein LTR56_013799 [Elasticomyces elasticus]|nr:hypothetical protein LTR56_013799 [Elasticomyces elasticus]KAK3647449.1 hypothetical protein LTR22_013742 [Elasticomyces elasticus]KAK4904339.1 hypothetical protein LTR49_026193 [Elasticomyces elasticus]KAK5750199.1 hypothetical protein LTS12_019763 [Elasticomyces elasticus]
MAPPEYCHLFQSGNCRKDRNCKYEHALDPEAKRTRCSYADRGCRNRGCPYLHGQEIAAPVQTATNNANSMGPRLVDWQGLLRTWRSLIPVDGFTTKPRALGFARQNFCKQAYDLVNGDAGIAQEMITRLASEGGCIRVTEIVERDFDQCTAPQFSRIFDSELLPFCTVITHKNVVTSLILAPRLNTVYRMVYGENGLRAASLFSAMAKHVQSMNLTKTDNHDIAEADAVDTVTTILATFHKLVEVNTEAQVHSELKLVVQHFREIFDTSISPNLASAFNASLKHLRGLERRFGLGQALPDARDSARVAGSIAVFELARERPGNLSEHGPRHDNDHADIRKISILPTLREIQSTRDEYLPLADPQDWHVSGLQGLLDRHFRLLREDTVGQLRDAARFEWERLHDPQAQRPKQQGARTFVYRNVAVSGFAFDSYNGLEFAFSFDQPKELQTMTLAYRREWWEGSRRLGADTLLCLLSAGGSAAFFMVSPSPMRPRNDVVDRSKPGSLHKSYDLWSEQDRAHVVARPVNQSDIYPLLEQLLSRYPDQRSLVEFPGVLLPAFRPTLEAMQSMSESQDVPFASVLAPQSQIADPNTKVDTGPPIYALKPDFSYDLSSITEGGTALRLIPAQNIDETITELTAHSKLDHGQAEAVIHSLSRSLALIQGPPGTGKSYTGVQLVKILLSNKKAGDLGPIVCVCFTNHALDQGLERLVDEGVQRIVRIGGSSKSARLARVNLREILQRVQLTKTEWDDRGKLISRMDSESKEINRILSQMKDVGSEASVDAHLHLYYPEVHAQLFGATDSKGWKMVGYNRGRIVAKWLYDVPWSYLVPRTIEDLQNVHPAYMTGYERRMQYNAWAAEMRDDLQNKLKTAINESNTLKERIEAVRTETELRVLREANIIGITTSGLARNLDLIRRTGAKVLICEEAGEVLESHLLTALLPSVEHAILIGDHQQLRPHVQNYSLSCESKNGAQYALDLSLFERLVQPQDVLAPSLPFCTLSVQRRMHPSISQLIRKTIYPQLQDAKSLDRPLVVGMRQRLFWLHHEHEEHAPDDAETSFSHSNDYEVDMVSALVKHLVHQGVYSPADIAVITPYLGQLRKLRDKLSTFGVILNDRDVDELLKGGPSPTEDLDPMANHHPATVTRGNLAQAVRIATVDNFQGEEAKVVIVSLVRSNASGNPGFLRTTNRINVLLSRAKNGMYIIGDANTMGQVEMWNQVAGMLKDQGCLGSTLELCCPRHEDEPLPVKRPEDFLRLSAEGGCSRNCEAPMSCDHVCPSACHSSTLHDAVYCNEDCCRKREGCEHSCFRRCGDPCSSICLELVEGVNVKLDCGHHKTTLPCYQHQDLTKVSCDVMVEKMVPNCNHIVTEPCYVDVESKNYHCLETCGGEIQGCSHSCMKACFKCRKQNDDGDSEFEHGECTQICGKELCGETCPSAKFCQKCGSDEIKAMKSDLGTPDEGGSTPYGLVDLDIEPCLFLPCGHILTVCSMDSWMDFEDYFEVDDEVGDIHGLKQPLLPFSMSELKGCPTCRGSLQGLARYGRIANRGILDSSAKKLTFWSNKNNADLAERLATDQEELRGTLHTAFKPTQDVKLDGREIDQHKAIKTSWTSSRYRTIYSTRNQIQTFAEKIRKEEGPYQRIFELAGTARRQSLDGETEKTVPAPINAELQLQERLQTTSLLLRCDLIILSDVIHMQNQIAPGAQRGKLKVDFSANRVSCDELVKEAKVTSSVRQEAEDSLFWARFAAMECGAFDSTNGEISPDAVKQNQEIINNAIERLSEAEQVCKRFADSATDPTQGLRDEILDVRQMLSEGVPTSESRMLVVAMAHECLETGTWRSCKNGHPFTVGTTAKLSNVAQCPACGPEAAGQDDDDGSESDAESVGGMEVQLGDTHL